SAASTGSDKCPLQPGGAHASLPCHHLSIILDKYINQRQGLDKPPPTHSGRQEGAAKQIGREETDDRRAETRGWRARLSRNDQRLSHRLSLRFWPHRSDAGRRPRGLVGDGGRRRQPQPCLCRPRSEEGSRGEAGPALRPPRRRILAFAARSILL